MRDYHLRLALSCDRILWDSRNGIRAPSWTFASLKKQKHLSIKGFACINMQAKRESFLHRYGYQSITINIYLNTGSYSSRITWINCICFIASLVTPAGLEEPAVWGSSGLLLAASGVRNVTDEELAPPCGLWKMNITSPKRSILHFSKDAFIVYG